MKEKPYRCIDCGAVTGCADDAEEEIRDCLSCDSTNLVMIEEKESTLSVGITGLAGHIVSSIEVSMEIQPIDVGHMDITEVHEAFKKAVRSAVEVLGKELWGGHDKQPTT